MKPQKSVYVISVFRVYINSEHLFAHRVRQMPPTVTRVRSPFSRISNRWTHDRYGNELACWFGRLRSRAGISAIFIYSTQ